MTAEIRINGVPGSDVDLPIDTLVQLANTTAEGSYLWAIADQPPGAADALSSTTAANPTFTPKKEGTYRITLRVNGSAADEDNDSVVAAVLQVKTGTRIPAAGETIEADATKGWAPTRNDEMRNADDHRADPFTRTVQVGGAVTLVAGDVVRITDKTTIKAGLPGAETMAVVTLALATSGTAMADTLWVAEAAIDGGAMDVGELVRVRRVGLVVGGIASGASDDDDVYVSDAGKLSLTPGSNSRRCGVVVAASGGVGDVMFDGATGVGVGGGGPTWNVIDPAALASDQDDYAPTGWSAADVAQLTASAVVTISGFDASVTEKRKWIVAHSLGSGDYIRLAHEDSGSAAANRITCPDGLDALLLGNGDAVLLVRDETNSRWRVERGETYRTNEYEVTDVPAGTEDDYLPDPEFHRASLVTLSCSSYTEISGFDASDITQRVKVVQCKGFGPLALLSLSGSSASANRMSCPKDQTLMLGSGEAAMLIRERSDLDIYNGWRVFPMVSDGRHYDTDTSSGSQNPWNYSGGPDRVDTIISHSKAGALTVLGLVPPSGSNPRKIRKTFINQDTAATHTVTLSHDDAAAAAANRIVCPNGENYVIGPGEGVIVEYQQNVQRWYVIGSVVASSTSGGGSTGLPWASATFTGAGPHALLSTVINLFNNAAGDAMVLDLPSSPTDGQLVVFKNVGNATADITVDGGANDIESEGSSGGTTYSLDMTSDDILHGVWAALRWHAADSLWRWVTATDSLVELLGTVQSLENGHPRQRQADSQSGSVNNWLPTTVQGTWNATDLLVWSSGSASLDITGLATTTALNKTRKTITNGDSTYLLVIRHDNASSSVANRILCPLGIDFALRPGQSIIVEYDGTSSRWRVVSGESVGQKLLARRIITSGTSTAKTPGAISCRVWAIASGGAGGGVQATGASEHAAGSGGAQGGITEKFYVTCPATHSYSIGALAAGASGSHGTDGNDTTYTDGTTQITAKGGKGGEVGVADTGWRATRGGLTGGVGTNGDLNTAGAQGGHGFADAAADPTGSLSGAGASGPYGGGGDGQLSSQNGVNATGFGAGGGGALNEGSNSARPGGDSSPGAIIIEEYIE